LALVRGPDRDDHADMQREHVMNAFTHHRVGTTRLGVVVALLLIVAGATAAHAESVYKCRDAAGHVGYQDRACANPAQETRIEIAPAPPPAASPDYAVASDGSAQRHAGAQYAATRRGHEGAVSYECRTEDGEVFYKHSGCPKSIPAAAAHERGSAMRSTAVSARPLARSEACKRLIGAGSIGRAGHEHDDVVSTYDRNAGRDPCRHS
jgi:hypothetical protein